MEQQQGDVRIQMPRVKLGSQGLEVSKLGFGCMGLTGWIAIILRAFERGVTFFDSSDAYGPLTNEILLGKALKQLPREKVQVATKFGIAKIDQTGLVVKGTPEYVRASCEASLQRLGLDYIDLYYQHRIDTSVPIEETIGEMKKLVEEGKVKYIGLSEASPNTIRRAHAVHPVTALQIEWSSGPEISKKPLELGIGIVPYSPLGRGFFAGKAIVESLPENSPCKILAWKLVTHPRFSGGNFEKNKVLYARLTDLAAKHQCTPAQLALAWILYQGDDVAPIPGTTKIKNLDDNIDSLKVKLAADELKEILDAVPLEEVAGHRTYAHVKNATWESADTPSLGGSNAAAP
ncbi:unnamed protein product [Spirodela intermedia]|uniref:NADP-dependent oxidoreductase domain-containing protein n=1 Tax=Spirodela intermedia TaxID=51605 RepID=A0A7I8I8I6_SPIIN|nr:unnamed protein product [Spirodela intermedia]CAA6653733.1 unnamed protein product [Spirodela intermedia]